MHREEANIEMLRSGLVPGPGKFGPFPSVASLVYTVLVTCLREADTRSLLTEGTLNLIQLYY